MRWGKIAKVKFYFDIGYGLTSYVKWLIAFYGISSLDPKTTLIIGSFYIFLCLGAGYWAYNYGFQETMTEIGNQINPFVEEIRKIFREEIEKIK